MSDTPEVTDDSTMEEHLTAETREGSKRRGIPYKIKGKMQTMKVDNVQVPFVPAEVTLDWFIRDNPTYSIRVQEVITVGCEIEIRARDDQPAKLIHKPYAIVIAAVTDADGNVQHGIAAGPIPDKNGVDKAFTRARTNAIKEHGYGQQFASDADEIPARAQGNQGNRGGNTGGAVAPPSPFATPNQQGLLKNRLAALNLTHDSQVFLDLLKQYGCMEGIERIPTANFQAVLDAIQAAIAKQKAPAPAAQ